MVLLVGCVVLACVSVVTSMGYICSGMNLDVNWYTVWTLDESTPCGCWMRSPCFFLVVNVRCHFTLPFFSVLCPCASLVTNYFTSVTKQ